MLGRLFRIAVCTTTFILAGIACGSAQSRVALVIGNSSYQAAPPLPTAAVDAEIIAETLRGAGYDVTELHDLRKADIGRALRDFLDKAAAAGPDGAAIFYYSGHAAQFGDENYLVPIDSTINRKSDVADEAFRLDDLVDEFAKLSIAARVVILDASRDHKFGAAASEPVPKGLAAVKGVPGMLIAFAAAPGAVSAAEQGTYSAYTGALVTLMRQPGLDIDGVLKAAQQQISKATSGRQLPWQTGRLPGSLILFAAPAPPAPPAPQAEAAGMLDMSKIACKQFLALGPAEIGTILTWLDGYYRGHQDASPIFDSKAFTDNAKKLGEYCVAHPASGLIDATYPLYKMPVR